MSTLLEYKCPCCGGAIAFDSASQKLKCPYCDTEFDVETLKSYDEDLKKETPDDMKWQTEAGKEWQEGEAEGMRVYVCDSCGGELAIRKDDAPETVKNRLKVFHDETEPLKAFYEKMGILKEIQGNQPIEGATKDILAALGADV